MTDNDKRLIEDYLPIEAISAEASREKSVRKGHISTLHLWWARRPLVACRAAVYGMLVPASRFLQDGTSDEKAQSLGRANAAKFVQRLCRYPSDNKPEEKADIERAITEAQQHILEAHAERLTRETGRTVTVDDIGRGRAPRPKVLDMFAGGGAIPLEALRLGCEAYALDLNPVAHIIELCTLVYPQKHGAPDPTARGMTGPKNTHGDNTWGGLAEEVRYWGNRVLKQVKAEVGNLYPLIPDPEFKPKNSAVQADWLKTHKLHDIPQGHLTPLAYLWTRSVQCKNPSCLADVPLFKHTWLNQKTSPYLALEPSIDAKRKTVSFHLRSSHSLTGFSFDPDGGSHRGSTVCPFCHSAVANTHVMDQGMSGHLGNILMCVVTQSPDAPKRSYIGTGDVGYDLATTTLGTVEFDKAIPNETKRLLDVEIPFDKRESFWCRKYGLVRFTQLFTPRQQVFLGKCAQAIANIATLSAYDNSDVTAAVQSSLSCWLDKLSEYNSSLCSWNAGASAVRTVFARQALPMVWDYAEINPFAGVMGDASALLAAICEAIAVCATSGSPAQVFRGSATDQPFATGAFDCVITDPPYYDNISYAKLADFFYIWMRHTLGGTLPQHFATQGTPKKMEAIVDIARAHGDKEAASREYEALIHSSFLEAHRVLKPMGYMLCIYAHKTTLGWATLVDSLRNAGFVLSEAWPLDTERKARIRAAGNASLSTSIFLVARKRTDMETGDYEQHVRPELEAIVRERVETLWDMGVSGADLVIACVGAGMRAFSMFARVEYSNGQEVPAERFLAEVETVVLETLLTRLSEEVGGSGGKHSLAGLDAATRFYILWRYTYKAADLDAGEAIIFANGTHVELDGAHGLSSGGRALVAKSKSKYSLLDYTDRGDDEKLGLPIDQGQAVLLIDVLHRTLWLMEKRPALLAKFLQEAQPNRDQMRLVAQALAGPALKGGDLDDVSPTEELAALTKLMANWRSVIEEAAITPAERQERATGQTPIDFGKERRR